MIKMKSFIEFITYVVVGMGVVGLLLCIGMVFFSMTRRRGDD